MTNPHRCWHPWLRPGSFELVLRFLAEIYGEVIAPWGWIEASKMRLTSWLWDIGFRRSAIFCHFVQHFWRNEPSFFEQMVFKARFFLQANQVILLLFWPRDCYPWWYYHWFWHFPNQSPQKQSQTHWKTSLSLRKRASFEGYRRLKGSFTAISIP